MKLELSSDKLRAATVNVIDMGDGVVIKRGRMEIKVAGDDAAKMQKLLDALEAIDDVQEIHTTAVMEG